MNSLNFVFWCFSYSFLAIAVCFCPLMVRANDTCFLQGVSGQSMDLSHLCGLPKNLETPTPRQKLYQIPIKQRVGNIPTVEVIINGKLTVEMLFDTGANAIVLNQAIAEKLGVVYSRDRAIIHTAGGMVASPLAYLNSLQAGRLLLKNLEVVITPDLGGIAGLLGQPFFANYDITIKEKVIELRAR